jgi:hypothetical protein
MCRSLPGKAYEYPSVALQESWTQKIFSAEQVAGGWRVNSHGNLAKHEEI